MRNIVNILKYNFGKYYIGTGKILYIIAFSILLINTSLIFVKIPIISGIISLINIGFICTFLGLNFIGSIIRFTRQISKEKGKLLFTFPIKSSEFLIAKILEFIIIQGAIVLVASIISLFSSSSLNELIIISAFSVAYGTIVSYIVVISLIIIIVSYTKNMGLSVAVTLIGGSIISGIIESIILSIIKFLPYFYIKIGTFIEIDIIYFILSLGVISLLVYSAIYHLERKLDII